MVRADFYSNLLVCSVDMNYSFDIYSDWRCIVKLLSLKKDLLQTKFKLNFQ